MKNKFNVVFMMLLLVLSIFTFNGCFNKGDDEPKNTKPTIESLTLNQEYIDAYQYQPVDVSNITATVFYSDGSTKNLTSKDLDFKLDHINTEFDEDYTCSVSYEYNFVTLTVKVKKLISIDVNYDGNIYVNEEISRDKVLITGHYENNNSILMKDLADNPFFICDVVGNETAGENKRLRAYVYTIMGEKNVPVLNKLDKNLSIELNEGVYFNKGEVIDETSLSKFKITAKINNVDEIVKTNIELSNVDTTTIGTKTLTFKYSYTEFGVTQFATGSIDIEISEYLLVYKTIDESKSVYFESGEDINFVKGKNNFNGFYFVNQKTAEEIDVTESVNYDVIDSSTLKENGINVSYQDANNVKFNAFVNICIYSVNSLTPYYLVENEKVQAQIIELYNDETFDIRKDITINFMIKYCINKDLNSLSYLEYDGKLDSPNANAKYFYDKLIFNPETIDFTVAKNNVLNISYTKPNGEVIKENININVKERLVYHLEFIKGNSETMPMPYYESGENIHFDFNGNPRMGHFYLTDQHGDKILVDEKKCMRIGRENKVVDGQTFVEAKYVHDDGKEYKCDVPVVIYEFVGIKVAYSSEVYSKTLEIGKTYTPREEEFYEITIKVNGVLKTITHDPSRLNDLTMFLMESVKFSVEKLDATNLQKGDIRKIEIYRKNIKDTGNIIYQVIQVEIIEKKMSY